MTAYPRPGHPLPYVLTRAEAPALWLVGTLWLPLATGAQTDNQFILIEQEFMPGPGPVSHSHPYHEAFYVLEGEFTYRAGGQSVTAGPGTFLHIPSGVQHGFDVEKSPARALNFYPASGFELLLMSITHPAAERRLPGMKEVPLPPPEQVEILSRLFGMKRAAGMPFIDPPTPANLVTAPAGGVHVLQAAAAPAFDAQGSHWQVLLTAAQTDGVYSVVLRTLPAGSEMPEQVHDQAEGFYVLSGTLRARLGGQQLQAPAESFVLIPAGCPQQLTAPEEVQLLLFLVPGGYEEVLQKQAAGAV
ncbi:cupin domain-containing protein [Hymenobacter sp. H14-R3]|uniref:cupin domain-containing protein n=1 Tax=Hymenobacter sp. H14-R3 TaxID=3046308 RepID=UPI0024BAFB51|nr:cupin domain-containing protein [Hymenobacter sp. H14-R3]MDJ0367796.1 cupin domain-containing protein [Hymenobacter sp. H14-R3]